MKFAPFTLALALAVVGSSALARSPPAPETAYSAQYHRCLETGDAARGVSPAMAGCINTELRKQDARLNTAYAAARRRLSAKDQAVLKTAQRAWIKRRDAECAEGLTGGTIDMIERPSCHLRMTVVRADELYQMGQGATAPAAKPAAARSEARSFAYDNGVVDLLVIGPAAQTLYDRLPGQGLHSACGAAGLHKGDRSMTCVKATDGYSCHLWLDVRRQSLAPPETDDC